MSITQLPPDEDDLMILIGANDIRAFEVFFDRHSGAAFSLAMRTLNDRVLAADATQEAFLSCWSHRATYRPEKGSSTSWLLGIVRHRAIDTWRRERNSRADVHDDQRLAEQPAPDCTEEQAVAGQNARDEQRSIRALLDELPFEQRRVIELAYFDGLTHTEIATQLGLPLGTAKGRMRLGLDKLRTALSEPAPDDCSVAAIRRGSSLRS